MGMRSYLETTIAKSRKIKKGKTRNDMSNVGMEESSHTETKHAAKQPKAFSPSLESATEEDLTSELARRRAAKFKLSGAMKRLTPEGLMCSLTGGEGMIPCQELME